MKKKKKIKGGLLMIDELREAAFVCGLFDELNFEVELFPFLFTRSN